ncbi:hypothetical protein BJV82DRAFT_633425 [Fennellomyces sp. T-0311]|nr:hypothetical protein BJV82DRAFT_633425 [Fennellomyces sp. T-0311]
MYSFGNLVHILLSVAWTIGHVDKSIFIPPAAAFYLLCMYTPDIAFYVLYSHNGIPAAEDTMHNKDACHPQTKVS